MKLLNLMDKLINRDLETDESFISILNNLDITVIDGKVNFDDVDRLTKPLIDNINELTDLYFLANNLETYSTFYINKDYLHRNSISFNELFPLDDLQIIYGKHFGYKGYVPWSENQKNNKVLALV